MKGKFEGYLLVSDMDGTLLDDKGKLSEENKNAIRYFVENGGLFTLATGRMLPSAGRFVKHLNIGVPVILYNGVKIYDYNKKEVIYEGCLEEERKSIIIKLMNDFSNLGVEVYSEEKVYIFKSVNIQIDFQN